MLFEGFHFVRTMHQLVQYFYLLSLYHLMLLGDNRNDVYITVERGEYDKGTKTAQRNIEVCVVVVKDTGEVKQVSYDFYFVHITLYIS